MANYVCMYVIANVHWPTHICNASSFHYLGYAFPCSGHKREAAVQTRLSHFQQNEIWKNITSATSSQQISEKNSVSK